MPKNIQLSEEVYNNLTSLMKPKETYSEVVARLLTLHSKMGELATIIEGGIKYEDWRREQLEKQG